MVRTTVSLDPELYQQLKAHCEVHGIRKLNDLVSLALKEFLRRSRAEEYDRLMEEAANCPQYQQVLRELSQDLIEVDGLEDY